jgi:hypothetical protein
MINKYDFCRPSMLLGEDGEEGMSYTTLRPLTIADTKHIESFLSSKGFEEDEEGDIAGADPAFKKIDEDGVGIYVCFLDTQAPEDQWLNVLYNGCNPFNDWYLGVVYKVAIITVGVDDDTLPLQIEAFFKTMS